MTKQVYLQDRPLGRLRLSQMLPTSHSRWSTSSNAPLPVTRIATGRRGIENSKVTFCFKSETSRFHRVSINAYHDIHLKFDNNTDISAGSAIKSIFPRLLQSTLSPTLSSPLTSSFLKSSLISGLSLGAFDPFSQLAALKLLQGSTSWFDLINLQKHFYRMFAVTGW